MPDAQIPIIKGDTKASNTDYRDLLPVNYTAVKRDILGATGYLRTHSGLTAHGTGVGVDRGGFWNANQGNHFRISGQRLLILDANGDTTDVGEITGTKSVSLANSFQSQAFVTDGKYYRYDGTTLQQVTGAQVGNPVDITWVDGFYFFTDGQNLYHTQLTDETVIAPGDFDTSEISPDPTLAVDRTSDNQVIVFDRYTTTYFVFRAADEFSFRALQDKGIKCGIVGTHCETELEGRFYIIGGGREEATSIHAISAGTYSSIATREIDKVLAQYTDDDLFDAVLETRVEDRDRFLIARLPNETLLFNATIAQTMGLEAAWTIVKSDVNGDRPWRGVNGVYDPRVPSWVYGDNLSANIGLLDNTVATQYGNIVESIFYTPLIDLETASIDELELDTITGFNVDTEKTTVAFSITEDGVFYGGEEWELYGENLQYGQRFILRRIGYIAKEFGFKFRVASPNITAFSKLDIKYG